MKTIEYKCSLFTDTITYDLIQHQPNESFQLYHGNKLIGSVIKVGDKCVQVGGREMSEAMLTEICKLI